MLDHDSAPTGKSAAELLPLVYTRLRALARHYMKSERSTHTLEPTALVHEAYLRLAPRDRIVWQSRTHFYAVAASQMRRVLVDYARANRAEKRGNGLRHVTLTDRIGANPELTLDLLALDEALVELAGKSPRQCRVAEMRLFSGLLVSEIATVLDVSERTVKQDWRMARAWLSSAIRSGDG